VTEDSSPASSSLEAGGPPLLEIRNLSVEYGTGATARSAMPLLRCAGAKCSASSARAGAGSRLSPTRRFDCCACLVG
jgi:hypothetical protein